MCPVLREGNKERFYQKLYRRFPDLYDTYENEFEDEKNLRTQNQPELMRVIRELCEERKVQYDKEELLRFTREYKNNTIGTQLSLFDIIQ